MCHPEGWEPGEEFFSHKECGTVTPENANTLEIIGVYIMKPVRRWLRMSLASFNNPMVRQHPQMGPCGPTRWPSSWQFSLATGVTRHFGGLRITLRLCGCA